MLRKITSDDIDKFLKGSDPMERIISIECDYRDKQVNIIYKDANGNKRIKKDDYKPFAWVKQSACLKMCDGDRRKLMSIMQEYGINCKKLITSDGEHEEEERLTNGYKFIFFAYRAMSQERFSEFFKKVGVSVYSKNNNSNINKEILLLTPVEGYMVSTGKRLFKGYENYDDLKRLLFDIETQGLNPKVHAIDQIGIRTNKGFERIISVTGEGEERKKSEMNAIVEMLMVLNQEKPDIIAGYNSEVFDWDFIITRCEVLGYDFSKLSKSILRRTIYKRKKETVLKLGGETEYYKPTILWGHNIIDGLHAVRRAQALDSSMKSGSLKYVTKYLGQKKPNRVYVPGNKITQTWNVKTEDYAFNDQNGDWYKISEKKPLKDGYILKSGKYIVERYLLDDIWETDKVELTLNESNFLVGKMLPTSFPRTCTMGTAGIWKLIMYAWCYENGLAVPAFVPRHKFTGGLARLLKTGYVDRIVKLDYNSLYPSIILTWNINTPLDVMKAMLSMLEYILTQREFYKGKKAEFGAMANKVKDILKSFVGTDEEKGKLKIQMQDFKAKKTANDKKQLPLKILANSYFGSAGASNLFPFGDVISAEKTTCIGRMCLRLMIYHFTQIGYTPIVGDTDGFNFQMPKEECFRYTKEHPYISNGGGRNSEKGKEYVGVYADVAEFEDLYFNHAWNGGINKMGLGIDEFCDATINFARKNYADLMPDGGTKKVGNTIKSRKMSGFLETFLDNGIDLLLHGKGQEFLESYYNYIDKIYNYQIPLKDIASKGKIKKTIEEYKADCNTLTKAGTKKSRQAWYELAIQNGLNPNISDTIYYINTGTKKGHGDVKRIVHQFIMENGSEVELDTRTRTRILKEECANEGIEYKSLKEKQKKERMKKYIVREYDEIVLNCKLLPNSIIESEEDILCSEVDDLEYNVEKYIEQFNKRVKVLLVCFSPDIRKDIIITNPKDKKTFTLKESTLVNGFPNKESDQDTFEALMTPVYKEVSYWLSIDEVPPFVEECNINWDKLVAEFKEQKKREEEAIFKEEDKRYLDALANITEKDVEDFYEDGKIPSSILEVVELNSSDLRFYFKNIEGVSPSTGGYPFDDIVVPEAEEIEDTESEEG